MDTRMLFFQALSPVHTGTGQSVDVIDLPVAREKVTNWPYLPGSGLKGVFRDACEGLPFHLEAFGPETSSASESAGMLLFSDARLLCLPVRSFYGTFAWCTCPAVIARLNRDLKAAGSAVCLDTVSPAADTAAIGTANCVLTQNGNTAYLEDLDIMVEKSGADQLAAALAQWLFDDDTARKLFTERFLVLSDNMFTFLAETGTDVSARIAISDESKTVAKGALWYEEAIPMESLFWAPLVADVRGDVKPASLYGLIDTVTPKIVQIGGNATVGRGLVRFALVEV